MAFDPSQPFDIVSEPEDQPQDKPAFDPSKPFEVIGEREEDVAGKLETLSKVATDKPDEAARISSLSKKTGAPYDLVKTAPDQFENHVNQPDWKGLSDGAPKTAKYLGEDPERFQQARDDTQALSAIEQHRSTKDWANDLTVRAVQGFSLAGQGAIGLADMAHKADPYARIADYVLGSQSKTLSELLAKNGISFNDANSAADSLVSDASKSESARIADTYKNDGLLAAAKDTVTSPGYLSEKIVQSMPQMLVAMSAVRQRAGQILAEGGEEALKAAMPELAKLSAAIEGSQSAGNYAGGKAETGQLDDKAMVAAGGQGVTTALFGMLSNKIGAKFGIDDVEAAVGSGINYKDGVTGFLRRFLGTTAKEGPIEEGLQSASEQAWSNFGDGKDIGGGVLQAAVEGSIVGAVQGGAVLTGGEAVNAVDRRLSKAAKTEQAATQHINDIKTELAILENSKLAQRSPETMHEYLDHIDGEEKQTVFVDPSQLFNQGGVARADLERIAPSAAAQIDEALDKGGLIEIPKNELLIGLMGKPDIQGNVVQFLKADANADSLHDINTQREGLSQEMYDLASKQIEKSKDATKLTTQRDEIIQHLQDSMSAAGMDDAGNKHRAAMIASGIVSQAIREKVDPVELYKQQVGNISNAELQGGVFNQQNPFTQENGFETVEEIDFSLPEGFTSLDDGSNVKASASESGDQNGQQKFEFDQFGDRKTDPNEKDIQLSNFPKERGWRVYDKAKLLEGIRLASDKIRGELGRTGSSESQATRELTSGPLGPFTSSSVSSEIKGDRLFIYYVGQEQAELGLTDEAALTVILNKTGELVVNGPPADSATFEEFKKLGWADFAEMKDGEKSDFWTSLDGFEGLDGPKGLLNPGTAAMLADAHARLRAWRGEDKVLINWVRYTGATGNALNGRKGVAFFQSQIKNQTETPAFKKWFGDSKVVDADGKPLVVYHGTGKQFGNKGEIISGDVTAFDSSLSGKASKTGAPPGTFFFTNDPSVASSYTVKWQGDFSEQYKDNANVMPLFLSISKPLKVSAKGENWKEVLYKGEYRDINEIAQIAKESGKYDGVIVSRVLDHGAGKTSGKPATTYIAFDPAQIKSAIGNTGAFDPANPSILMQNEPAPRGTFNPITREIGLTNAADLSTFLHESGHLFLEITADLAAREGASEAVKKDMDTAFQWFGIAGETFADRMDAWNGMTLDEKRPYHEKWAESFEQYLFEGKAPSMELRDAFRNFRQWLTHVYKSLSQFVGTHDGAKLNDEMRSVFDRMLATEQQIEEMEAARGMLPLFSKKPAGMTESEWNSYRQAADEATQSAVEQLTSRSLRDMKWLANAKNKAIRKLQREAADERRVARMEARQQVLSQPVYRAWQFLKAPIEGSKAANKKAKQSEGVDSKRDSLFAAIAKLGGLNREEIMAQMGYGAKDFAAWKSGIFSKPVVRKDGGLSLDAMSEALSQHNYLTVDEHGKVEIGDLLDKAMEEMRGNKQYSTDADYDVLLGETQYAATPDAEQVDFVGGRLSRQAIRGMYDDADLANMQGEKVDTAGKLMQEEKYKPDLFVAHNLTAENLVHSDELGGLAAPSFGVSRTTTGGFTGFGEITLLADKSMLEDRDARTFDADVYSPRHPRAVHKIDNSAVSDLEKEVNASQGKLAGMEMRLDSDSLERRGLDELLNNDALKNSFLVSKGILIKPKMKAVPDAVKQAIKYLDKNAESKYAYESYNLRDEDWFIKLTEKHYAAEFEKLKSLSDTEFNAADLVKYGPYEADGSLKPYLADQLARQVASYHKNGGQDSYANQTAIAKKFRDPKLEKEFVAYAEEKFKTISKEKRLVKYTKNGNAKYSAYNLDNIVAEMTRELQGGEGFNYGAGSVRSAFAFEFKRNTIESIKSFKGGIVSKEEMNKVRDEANDKLGDALDKLRKFYKYDSSSFGYSNDASSAIAEGQKGQAEAFRMTAESKAIIKELTTYLRELPSEYFETKMQRAVGIGEFKAAIVPKGTDQKVLDILARNGISKIDFYDPKKPGARTKAISKQDGLLFQPGRDKQQMLKDTDMATSDDYGVRFETGVPVTFNFLHNKESATKLYGKPKKDSQWNRGYEPAGRFMIQVSKAELPSYGKFDTGSITFKNPIVIENDSLEWKKKLSSLYGGKTGKRLSVAIIDDGFDGIVTVDKGHTSEIVDLTTFDYKKALYQIGEEKDANDKRTLESLGVMSDEGLHPDTVADLFGLSSGDELVRKLLTMPDPVSEIERLTDEIMLQRHSDLATPEGRERAAESAIHNEARAKFIATELAMLNRAIGKPRMIMAAAKEYAGQIVSALRVRDLKTGQYDAAEAKASKEADKALRDGNTAAAALAKRNQVLHNMTAKMVRDAQDEVEKAVRYLKKFDKPNKKIDIDYQEQIDTLLERYDLRQKTLKAIERSQNLAQWIEQQKAEGLEPVIPDYLQDEAKRTNYKMLTVEELRGLVDAVKNIEHLGRLKNRLLTDKAKRELNALADGIGKSIADNGGDVKPSKLERNTAVDRLSDLASGFFSMHRKLASIVRQLDGWKDGGILWDAMIRPMNEAGDAEAVMHEKSTMALAEVFVSLKDKKLTKKLYIPMIATSLSYEGRLAVALNWGNEGNRQRLMDGDKWGVGEVNAILATLTAEDWKFVQGVWDHIATYKDEIGEQQRRLTGVEPSWVDATPFEIKTADGQTVQVQGGYYPAKYDTTRSTQALSNEAAGNVFDQWRAAKGQGKTRDGFTKSRATQVKDRPLRKDFGVITQHITEVTHRLAWQDWVVDMNRLIKKEQVDSSIRAHYGNEILEEIRKAIEDITTGDVTAQSSYEQAINHLRIGTTIVGLGWNLTTSLLQPFGLTQSMVRIGPKWVAKGLATWIGNPARMNERTDWVYSKSDFMRLRGKTMMREMNEILNTVRKEKLSKIEATYFYGIQKMQVIADMPTWLGQYEKSMAEFDGDESKAIALADQAVLDAQGGGQNKDLARIQRGGPLLKLWTNFYSYFNTTYNLTREVAGRTDAKDPASVAKSAIDMLLLYTIPSVMVSLLKGAIIGDDDEDELADRLWRDQLGYLFGSMVGLREISAAFSGFNGYSGPAGTRFFSEIARLGKQAEQGEADAPFLKSLNNVGGILFHYPAGQINRTVEGANALYNGETDGPAALIFGKPK